MGASIMTIVRKILGAKSKYDKSLPYTYMARVPVIEGEKDLYNYYYADTICGLVEYLAENEISPQEAELFGLFRKEELPLEKSYCLSKEGQWLNRPEICRSLEEHFRKTLEKIYKGHVEDDPCAFDDRKRQGSGPY
jgi:hypothetical protein